MKRKYGWKPELPDFRDYHYRDVHSPAATGVAITPDAPHVVNSEVGDNGLPKAVSLLQKMPPVFDQGQTNSCTANAGATMWQYVHGGPTPSRMQIYHDERVINGTVNEDSGAYIRDIVKVLVNTGAGPETDWPFIPENLFKEPPAKELAEAAQNKATVYSRLSSRKDYRECLAQGFPFVVGISVYEELESDEVAQTGIVPMPGPFSQMMGGHAVCIFGYDTNFNGGDYYRVRNSWGAWGYENSGDFWLPAEYLENSNLADDAWSVRR